MAVFKNKAIVVEGRLLCRGLPLMSPVHTERVLSSEVDLKAVSDATGTLSMLLLAKGAAPHACRTGTPAGSCFESAKRTAFF